MFTHLSLSAVKPFLPPRPRLRNAFMRERVRWSALRMGTLQRRLS